MSRRTTRRVHSPGLDAAAVLHAQLTFRAVNHPTKVGAALRAVIARHAPEDDLLGRGDGFPAGSVCRGEGVPVRYPCPTVVDVAAALEVPLPALGGAG